jgi:hypothetical protein
MQDRMADLMGQCEATHGITKILAEKNQILSWFQPTECSLTPSCGVKQCHLEAKEVCQPVNIRRGY